MTFSFKTRSLLTYQTILVMGFFAITTVAIARISHRIETTVIGYELGNLKVQEAELLQDRGSLNVQLAKVSTKKHLRFIAESKGTASKSIKKVAQKN